MTHKLIQHPQNPDTMKVAKIKWNTPLGFFESWVTSQGRIAKCRSYVEGGSSQFLYDQASGLGDPAMGDCIQSLSWLKDSQDNCDFDQMEWVDLSLPAGFDRFPQPNEVDFSVLRPKKTAKDPATAGECMTKTKSFE